MTLHEVCDIACQVQVCNRPWQRSCARALALRDYYPFWKSRNERSRAGKLLVLDPDDHGTIQARAARHRQACCACERSAPKAVDKLVGVVEPRLGPACYQMQCA